VTINIRILSLLLAIGGVVACGDPVRMGDRYNGELYARFAGRLTGPPMGYQEDDPLMQIRQPVGGPSSKVSRLVFPRSFPHDFTIDVLYPPHLTELWFIEFSLPAQRNAGPPGRAASLNHWLAYSEGPVRLHPLGADGPALDLPGGYRLIRRTCSPGQLNQLAVVPSDEVMMVEPLQHDTAENEYRARCGAPLLP
jgi:hypothetical protein